MTRRRFTLVKIYKLLLSYFSNLSARCLVNNSCRFRLACSLLIASAHFTFYPYLVRRGVTLILIMTYICQFSGEKKARIRSPRYRFSKLPKIAIKINKLLRRLIGPSVTQLLYIHISERIQNITNLILKISNQTDRNLSITLIEEIAFNIIFVYRYDNCDTKHTPSHELCIENFIKLP